MTETMYHGNGTGTLSLHIGLCLTDDGEIAGDYAAGYVHRVSINLDGLTILDLGAAYDHDANEAPGDNGEDYGADVITFTDESPWQRRHDTWRLMTPAALAAITDAAAETLER